MLLLRSLYLPAITENEANVERSAVLGPWHCAGSDLVTTFDERVQPALAGNVTIYASYDTNGDLLGYAYP